jgi:hypothetical protein
MVHMKCNLSLDTALKVYNLIVHFNFVIWLLIIK